MLYYILSKDGIQLAIHRELGTFVERDNCKTLVQFYKKKYYEKMTVEKTRSQHV